jgi:hypothetical protein
MKAVKYFIFLLLFLPSLALATNLRGRVDATHSYSSAPFPARGAHVQLVPQPPATQGPAVSFFTGGDGMYYFSNIPPGQYMLVINNNLRFPLTVVQTNVQNIPPVLLRY